MIRNLGATQLTRTNVGSIAPILVVLAILDRIPPGLLEQPEEQPRPLDHQQLNVVYLSMSLTGNQV